MSTQTPALWGGLGTTLYGPTSTIDTAAYGSSVLMEGTKAVFDYTDPTDKTKKDNRKIHCIAVRNVSDFTLYAKRAVLWSTTNGMRGKRVAGNSYSTACEIAGIVDDRLGSGGVRNGDMFWLMVKGPAYILTGMADVAADLAAGDIMFALTAATSNATTAGRFIIDDGTFSATQTTTNLLGARDEIRNAFGVGMTASLTNNTNSAVLFDLHVPRSPGL